MRKILVAVDGSSDSDKALAEAKRIGICFNSDISIINVIEDIIDYPILDTQDYRKLLDNASKKHSAEILNRYMDDFKDYNGKIETISKSGNPGNVILKVAEDGEYDLIVMGSRGLNAISRVMLGSVSNKVVHHSNSSVLIIK